MEDSSVKRQERLDVLNDVLHQPKRLYIHFPHYPSKVNYKSYSKICRLSGIPKFEAVEFNILPKGVVSKGIPKNKAEKPKEAPKQKPKPKNTILQEFKPEVLEALEKEGSTISTGALATQRFMSFLYTLLIVLGACLFTFLCVHIYQDYLTLAQGEFITIMFSSLSILCGGMGIAKLAKHSKISFDKLNTLLYLVILNAVFFLGMKFCVNLAGSSIFEFCNNHFVLMVIFSSIAFILGGILLILNNLLEKFYHRYYSKQKDAQLLGNEVELVDVERLD